MPNYQQFRKLLPKVIPTTAVWNTVGLLIFSLHSSLKKYYIVEIKTMTDIDHCYRRGKEGQGGIRVKLRVKDSIAMLLLGPYVVILSL